MVTTSVIVGPLYFFSQIILSSQILSRGAWIEIFFLGILSFSRALYAFCYLSSERRKK
jgi:hypothetical protein